MGSLSHAKHTMKIPKIVEAAPEFQVQISKNRFRFQNPRAYAAHMQNTKAKLQFVEKPK